MVVDRDNLDDVLAHFHPALRLEGVHPDGSAVEIEFAELDDFHPDRLYERLPLFDTLRETHDRLESPETFAAAAAEVRSWAEAQAAQQSTAAGGRIWQAGLRRRRRRSPARICSTN